MKTIKKLALLLLALTGFIGVDAAAQQAATPPAAPAGAARTISLATLAPAGSTWMRIFEAWNRELRRASNNTLQFRIYGGGVQGDEAEVIRKIRSGRLDAASVTAVGLGQIYRPALVFQMPGILQTYAQLDRARDSLAGEMDTGFTTAGFHLLGWADVGQSRIFSTQATVTPADFASRHPWVWSDDVVLPAFYQVVQSHPVSLQVPEVLGALQTGRVDTAITPPVPCVALQWCARFTHMTDTGMTIVLGGTVMGHTQWASLTPEQQALFTSTATQFHTLARRNLRRDETAALRSIAEHGVTVDPVTPAQRTEWLNIASTVRGRLAGQVADQALIDRVAAFAR